MAAALALWLLCGLVAAALLSRSNRAGLGCVLGVALGPIGLLVAWTMAQSHEKAEAAKSAEGAEDRIARAVARALEEERQRRDS